MIDTKTKKYSQDLVNFEIISNAYWLLHYLEETNC